MFVNLLPHICASKTLKIRKCKGGRKLQDNDPALDWQKEMLQLCPQKPKLDMSNLSQII